MPSSERDDSRDRELVLKHQHSMSDSGRSSVPMWDSSDPDRAPPPLPLNPGSASPITKPNTSATVAAAAEALAARARESPYTINPMPPKSPEKSLIKGQYHKRMQSLQTGNGTVRDLSTYLENSRSSERSPERIPRMPLLDYEKGSPEKNPSRSTTPTPANKDLSRDMPSLRPTGRTGPKPILGENTPPSSTMLALQNMQTPADLDTPLTSITNSSTALTRTPQTYDAISSQILGLTTIATNLQREMAQLSRRSKDNATDLISLKEATNARDEDIRKSLRELVKSLSSRSADQAFDAASRTISHHNGGLGSFLIDNKPHGSPPGMRKNFSLPRIPSPNSFAATVERELASSPSPYSAEGAATLAMLEKIIREMGTKDGQERIMTTVGELMDKPGALASDAATAKKLEEILEFIKDNLGSRALVKGTPGDNGGGIKPPLTSMGFESSRSGPLARTTRDIAPHTATTPNGGAEKPYASPRAADFVSDDILKLLKRMKDSISEGGGLTAEIKALVRELRGEVLGMGREIGRKLEQAEAARGKEDSGRSFGPEEVARIVEEGLAELKEHMDRVMRENRRQSSSSTISRSTIDGQDIYNAVKSALGELPLQQQVAAQAPGSGVDKDDIIAAVKEAWETYKPEIELQNFGLERDEILQCLKEGLQQYQARNEGGASYSEVLDAVKEGLQNFTPPAVETEASITREEILVAVRECLETFQFPTATSPPTREPEITKDDVLDAVREGLSNQATVNKEIEFNRQDLFDAVAAGLEGVPTPMAGVGEQVLEKMQDLIDGIRGEFKQYSAANGRDTEQVLDAMKDGLEVLRAEIETYVDRAADVTGKDEIIDTVRTGLESLRGDLEGSIANLPQPAQPTNSVELLDAMEREFQHLRQTIATTMIREDAAAANDEILDSIREGFDSLKSQVSRDGDEEKTVDTIAMMKEEFEHLRETLETTLVKGGASADSDETIAMMKEEFEHLRETLATTLVKGGASSDSDEVIAMMKEEFEHLRETLATTLVKGGASADRDEIIAVLQEGLETVRVDVARLPEQMRADVSGTDQLLDALNDGLDTLRSDVEKMVNKPLDMTVNYEILDTLKDGLAGVRADIDRLRAEKAEAEDMTANRNSAVVIADESLRRNDIENLEVMIAQLRIKVEALDNMPTPPPPEPAPQPAEPSLAREDLERIESILTEVQAAVTAIAAREQEKDGETATKQDTDAIETLLSNAKAKIDEITAAEAEGMARTGHLEAVEAMIKDMRDSLDDFAARAETTSASKEDIGMLENLIKDIFAGLEEMREKAAPVDDPERITKTDVEAIGMICMDTKTQLEEMQLPDPESLPTKTELAELGGLVKDFQDKMCAEAELTAQAFEARKIEHGGIADKVEDVRVTLDQMREELKGQLHEGGQEISNVIRTLEALGETVAANDITTGVKELTELITREFERAHGDSDGARLESEDRHAIILDKHEVQRVAIVTDLSLKIDEKFDEMIMRYDDAQSAANEKSKEFGARNSEQLAAVNDTRAIVEDLKVSFDALAGTLGESCERLGEDSKTVFCRVEDAYNKVEETHAESKTERQQTRDEIAKTLTAIEGVQSHVTEYNPQILDTIKNVLQIVGQHYEHAQRSTEEIKNSVSAIPASLPSLPEAIAAALPALPPPSPTREEPLPVPEPYDDTVLQAKLDDLLSRTTEAGKSLAQIERLDAIHAQVQSTASEVSAFVSAQTSLLAEQQESKAREAAEAAIALEKRLAQKERVEAEVVGLNEEKEALRNDVDRLRREKDALSAKKARLNADVSSLETALAIRRQELSVMEAQAEGLERRILEGVLDHSRSLLIARPKKAREMNLKRVTSAASTSTASTVTRTNSSTLASSAVGMALKRRGQAPASSAVGGGARNPNARTPKSKVDQRRILSLSQITGNSSPGHAAGHHHQMGMVAAQPDKGFGGLKRSHSVKSHFPSASARKSSWATGGPRASSEAMSLMTEEEVEDDDKENSLLDEGDEENDDAVSQSDTTTERRHSVCAESTTDGGASSVSYTYGSGSVVSASEESLARRGSYDDGEGEEDGGYAPSTVGTVGHGDQGSELCAESLVDGEGEHHDEDDADDAAKGDSLVLYGKDHSCSDSGIGTDVPTAALHGEEKGSDYFQA